MKTYKRYTLQEDKMILKAINDNPQNLTIAFKTIATKLGRSENAISFRWYTYLSKLPTNKAFTLVGSKRINNRKNIKNSNPPIHPKLTIWEVLKSLFIR